MLLLSHLSHLSLQPILLAPYFSASCVLSFSSQTAWGLASTKPKNVELGVVLCTTDAGMLREWKERLPCALPTQAQMRRSAAARQYFPCGIPKDLGNELRRAATTDAQQQVIEKFRQWLRKNPGK